MIDLLVTVFFVIRLRFIGLRNFKAFDSKQQYVRLNAAWSLFFNRYSVYLNLKKKLIRFKILTKKRLIIIRRCHILYTNKRNQSFSTKKNLLNRVSYFVRIYTVTLLYLSNIDMIVVSNKTIPAFICTTLFRLPVSFKIIVLNSLVQVIIMVKVKENQIFLHISSTYSKRYGIYVILIFFKYIVRHNFLFFISQSTSSRWWSKAGICCPCMCKVNTNSNIKK